MRLLCVRAAVVCLIVGAITAGLAASKPVTPVADAAPKDVTVTFLGGGYGPMDFHVLTWTLTAGRDETVRVEFIATNAAGTVWYSAPSQDVALTADTPSRVDKIFYATGWPSGTYAGTLTVYRVKGHKLLGSSDAQVIVP